MAGGARLSEAIRAAMRAGAGSTVEGVIASEEAWSARGWPDAAPTARASQKTLARAVTDAGASCSVLVTHRLPATLMRALESAAPALVIVTARASDAELTRLEHGAAEAHVGDQRGQRGGGRGGVGPRRAGERVERIGPRAHAISERR